MTHIRVGFVSLTDVSVPDGACAGVGRSIEVDLVLNALECMENFP